MTTPRYDATIPAAAHGGRFSTDPPHLDVVHSTEGPMSPGNARALAVNWFGRPASQGGAGTSTTGIFDPVEGIRMLDEHTIPYHVGPDGNPVSTGDEHCGSVKLTRDQWLSPAGRAMLDQSARVKAERARARGWSLADCRWLTLSEVARKTVDGFCTHNDIRLALGGTTHSDPGPNFPYDWYMGRIRAWYQDPVNGGKDWLDMADINDLETAVTTVLRRELGADPDGNPSSRTALYELFARVVNAVLSSSTDRAVYDVPKLAVGSPARVGVDQIIESSSAVAGVKADVDALHEHLTEVEAKVDQILGLLTPVTPTS